MIFSLPASADEDGDHPLLIVIRLEEFNYQAAAALGFVTLVISFLMLLSINLLQAWGRRRMVAAGS